MEINLDKVFLCLDLRKDVKERIIYKKKYVGTYVSSVIYSHLFKSVKLILEYRGDTKIYSLKSIGASNEVLFYFFENENIDYLYTSSYVNCINLEFSKTFLNILETHKELFREKILELGKKINEREKSKCEKETKCKPCFCGMS